MKTKELKEKTPKELNLLLMEKRGALRNLRFKLAIGGFKNVRALRAAKKEIAKILTIINSKNKK